MHLEIIPFSGFDKIRLGQQRDEVEEILGPSPDKTEEIYPDGSWAYIYSYPHFGIDCTFDSEENFLLSNITFHKDEYTFNGKGLIGLKEKNLYALAASAGISDLKQKEDFILINSKNLYSESTGLSFWIKDGEVYSITLSPKYTEDYKKVIWPE